ncbi:hypothetical protein, partial [Eshraghiella crossota]|uniref:hypothetical protein n=1 Tax=Eshraghiella crossota TaxID=45851 RepID=UPI003F8003C7
PAHLVSRPGVPPTSSPGPAHPLTNLFPKCRKLGILPELPGKLLIIFAGELFLWKNIVTILKKM